MKYKKVITRDPYRNKNTTLAEFAAAEGVKKYAVSHFYWYHKTLEGFRNRPSQGGNGIGPHTYTHKGKFITIAEAERIARVGRFTLAKYVKRGITDAAEIRKLQAEKRLARMQKCSTPDGRTIPIVDYAKEMGVTPNALSLYIHRHGSLDGFADRGPSRVHPKTYTVRGYRRPRPLREWMQIFNVSRETLKMYLFKHGGSLEGFATRKRPKYGRHNPRRVTIDGVSHTFKEWAGIFGSPIYSIHQHFYRHGNLDNYNPKRKRGRPRKA